MRLNSPSGLDEYGPDQRQERRLRVARRVAGMRPRGERGLRAVMSGLLQASIRRLPRDAYARWLLRLLGLALFVVLITRFDLVEVTRLTAAISPLAWLAALLCNTGLLLASARRWQGMVRVLPEGGGFPFGAAVAQFLRYYALGLATPARAAEFARAWDLRRIIGVRLGSAAAVILLERGIDLPASLLLCWIGLGVLPLPWLRPFFALGLAGGAGLFLLVAFGRGALRRLLGFIADYGGRTWGNLGQEIGAMPETWRRFGGRGLVQPVFWTIVTHGLFLGFCVILGWGLALPVPPLALALAATLATVIGLLPLTFAGLGTREAALILLLAPYGVAPEAALAYSLALLVVFYGGGIVPGALLWVLAGERAPAQG